MTYFGLINIEYLAATAKAFEKTMKRGEKWEEHIIQDQSINF